MYTCVYIYIYIYTQNKSKKYERWEGMENGGGH